MLRLIQAFLFIPKTHRIRWLIILLFLRVSNIMLHLARSLNFARVRKLKHDINGQPQKHEHMPSLMRETIAVMSWWMGWDINVIETVLYPFSPIIHPKLKSILILFFCKMSQGWNHNFFKKMLNLILQCWYYCQFA